MKKLLRVLFIIAVFVMAAGQIFKFRVLSSDIKDFSIMINDVLLPAICVLFLIKKIRDGFRFAQVPLNLPFLCFVGWSAVATAIGTVTLSLEFPQVFSSGMYLVRWVYYAALFFVFIDVFDEIKSYNRGVFAFLAANSLIILIGYAQLLFLPGTMDILNTFPFLGARNLDMHSYRMVSSFLDPNLLGGFIILFLSYSIGLFDSAPDKKMKIVFGVMLSLNAVAVIATISRGGFISIMFLLALLGVIKYRKLFLVFAVLLVLVMILMPQLRERFASIFSSESGRDLKIASVQLKMEGSAYARYESWKRTLSMINESWLYGFGFNTLPYASRRFGYEPTGNIAFGCDSSLLLILITTGVIGLILYIWVLFAIFREGWNSYRNSGSWTVKGFGFGLTVGLPALLVNSTFTNSLLYVFCMESVWIAVGIVSAGALLANKHVEE